MDKGTYYCVIDHDKWGGSPGIYAIDASGNPGAGIYAIDASGYPGNILKWLVWSHSVWFQGPRGGVKKITHGMGSYITKDEKLMKEFMWAKLKAQPVNI